MTTCTMLLHWAGHVRMTPAGLNLWLSESGGFNRDNDGYLSSLDWPSLERVFSWTNERPLAFAAWCITKDGNRVWKQRYIFWEWDDPLSVYLAALERGLPVITEVDFIPETAKHDQHFVLAIGRHRADQVWVLDPWELDAASGRYPLPLERVAGYRLFVIGRMV